MLVLWLFEDPTFPYLIIELEGKARDNKYYITLYYLKEERVIKIIPILIFNNKDKTREYN